MAKQLVNPIERHFEKGLVGLAALVLIGVIARYLVTSPNKLELGGEPVTPSTIDAKVAQKAISIQERIRNARAEVEVPEPLFDDFTASLAPLTGRPLPIAAPVLPEVPLVDQPGSVVGQYELVKVVKLDKPAIASGRTTFRVPSTSTEESFAAINWVTASAVFNVKHQSEVQRRAYGARFTEIIYGPFELQRRERRPDGSWSEDSWQTVESWPAGRTPVMPSVMLVEENEKLTVPKDVHGNIDKYRQSLVAAEVQRGLLRPFMPPRVNGSAWSFPLITSYDDVLRQDDEFLHSKDPPAAIPEDSYGLRGETAPSTGGQPVVKKISERLAEIENMIKEAKAAMSPELAIQAHNRANDITSEEGVSASDQAKAEKVRLLADQTHKDIVRDIKRPDAMPRPTTTGPKAAFVRERLPTQQVWAHDAKPGSVMSGRTYQYRMRAWVFNQLAGDASKFADPQNAARLLVPGEWSEPSDPVTVPPAVEFYVTSDDEKREEVGIELFQWFDGVWVKDRFKYTIGDQLEGESRQKVPSLDNPQVADNPLVRFNGQATIIGVDFKHPFRDRKRGTSRDGFKIAAPTDACTVAFIDENGRLRERVVLVDKAHPNKKAATERVDSVKFAP